MTVFTVGDQNQFSLESSYRRGFEELGVQVRCFDIFRHQQAYIRLGAVGRLFHAFVPIETWQRKVNRDLALAIMAEKPDLVLVFCNAPVLAGTLAFIRSLTAIPLVLVWPDPLLQLQAHLLPCAPLYSGVVTYSKATIPVFQRLGFQQVQWVPLAADPHLHSLAETNQPHTHDLSFIGAWRPERERILATILHQFPALKLGIWGTNWHRATHRSVRLLARKRPLRGKEYAETIRASRINLNVIDDTGGPAANMRFFELPMARGLQLASRCPEFSDTYQHRQHVLYFSSETDLAESVNWVLAHPKQAAEIRQNGHELTRQQHTYRHRAEQLCQQMVFGPPTAP